MISPNDPIGAAAGGPEDKAIDDPRIHRRSITIDFIFLGTDAEIEAIAADAADGFKCVFRDVLLARMSLPRAKGVAVKCIGNTWVGPLPPTCLKEEGFGSVIP